MEADGVGGFNNAAWAPGSEWIATTLITYSESGDTQSLALVNRSTGVSQIVVPDGFNYSPLFSQDGQQIYYVRAETGDFDRTVARSLWVVGTISGQPRKLFDFPSGWSARLSGWTAEGYMILRLSTGCVYFLSCGSRLALLDPSDGSLVYLSAQRDFANFLGFVP
jgi:hypothetical protein